MPRTQRLSPLKDSSLDVETDQSHEDFESAQPQEDVV